MSSKKKSSSGSKKSKRNGGRAATAKKSSSGRSARKTPVSKAPVSKAPVSKSRSTAGRSTSGRVIHASAPRAPAESRASRYGELDGEDLDAPSDIDRTATKNVAGEDVEDESEQEDEGTV